MPELQAYWEPISHMRKPQETRNGGNGCLRYLRRISARCCRVLQELISGQGYRVRSSRVRNVERKSEVKEASEYITSSGVDSAHDAQTASRLEAKTETQGVERIKKWPCSYCHKDCFSARSNRITHERTSCRNRPPMCQHKHQQNQSPSSVNTQCRHQNRQMTPRSQPPQHNSKKKRSGMMVTIWSMVVETKKDFKRL